VIGDLFRRMGEIELHRPAAARLETHEQQPIGRGENVARMRLAMQHLASH